MGNCCKEERSAEYTKAIQTIFSIKRSDFNKINIFSSESMFTYYVKINKYDAEKYFKEDLYVRSLEWVNEFESLLKVNIDTVADRIMGSTNRGEITVYFKMTEENIKRWLLDTNFRLLPSCVHKCKLYEEVLLTDSMIKWFREHKYIVNTEIIGRPFNPTEVIAFNKT